MSNSKLKLKESHQNSDWSPATILGEWKIIFQFGKESGILLTLGCRFPPKFPNSRALNLGGGGELAPRLVFLLSTENGLRWGLEISWLPIHSLGMLYQIFEFLLSAEAPPGPLSRGHVCQVSAFFSSNFRKLQKFIMCDGLSYWETCPEIWPKSFKKQRSYNISKHLVKKCRLLFLATWTPNLRIFGIFENGSCSSRREK